MRQIWRQVAFLPVAGTIMLAVGSAFALSALRFPSVLSAQREAAPANGGVIVYWKESPWPSIWVTRPNGSRVHRILRNRQNAKRARLSPDRRWVAFDGAAPGKPPLSDFDIQIVRLDGTGRRTLTHADEWDLDAQWSPDGELLSFSRMPPGADWLHSVIWTVRRDGTDPHRIGPGIDARWSPDGKKFVFDAPTAGSPADLFVMDADGTNTRQLLASKALEAAAGWSADGRTILFTRFNDNSARNADVFVMNIDGTNVRKLAHGIAGSWSPDGSQIAYTAPFRLRLMSADGTHKRKTRLVGVWDPNWR
jgi:Tol biopolymer transport system component